MQRVHPPFHLSDRGSSSWGESIGLLETNQRIFNSFIAHKRGSAFVAPSATEWQELSSIIVPQSWSASFASRFHLILDGAMTRRLLIDETKRLYNRFLKDWMTTIAQTILRTRQAEDKLHPSEAAELRSSYVQLATRLKETLTLSRNAEILSKKAAFTTTKQSLHPIVMVHEEEKATESVFKVLSGTQMAGELTSYFMSLFCGVDYFHCVLPSYCWVQENGHRLRTVGIVSSYHDSYLTAYEICCSKSGGLKALEALPDQYVQGVCLMHMLRGSEDAHMKNSLIKIGIDPASGTPMVLHVQEIDGEHIMSSSEPHSDRYEAHKHVASMRIWWLGLPQAEKPLSEPMLRLILSWTRDKLLQLHAHIGLYPKAKIDAQLWRLEQMRSLALEALTLGKALSARNLFARLIHDHLTLHLLLRGCNDPLVAYNYIGHLSIEESTPSDPAVPKTL